MLGNDWVTSMVDVKVGLKAKRKAEWMVAWMVDGKAIVSVGMLVCRPVV